jgi:hypothetical protein
MQRKHTSIVRALRNDPKVLQRFWRSVRLTDDAKDCWEWVGPFGPGGYPTFRVAGRTIAASHVTWFTAMGELPEGGRLNRQCGNPNCVRPNHLAWALSRTMEHAIESLRDGYVALPGHAFTPAERGPRDPRVLRAIVATVNVPAPNAMTDPDDRPDGTAAAA